VAHLKDWQGRRLSAKRKAVLITYFISMAIPRAMMTKVMGIGKAKTKQRREKINQ